MENFKGESQLYNLMRGKTFMSMMYIYYIYSTTPNKSSEKSKAYQTFVEKTATKSFYSGRELQDLANAISPGLASTNLVTDSQICYNLL
jgi:hypothetical protein